MECEADEGRRAPEPDNEPWINEGLAEDGAAAGSCRATQTPGSRNITLAAAKKRREELKKALFESEESQSRHGDIESDWFLDDEE